MRPSWWVLLAAVVCLSCEPSAPHTGHGGMGELTSTPIAGTDRDALWVVVGGDKALALVDAERLEVLGTVQLGGVTFPHHVSLSPGRSFLVVADPGVDFSAGHTHTTDPLMPAMPGALLKLDARTGALLAGVRLEVMNHNGAVHPGGDEVWTTQMRSPGSVLVLDARTLETRATLPAGNDPTEVSFSPDGTRAFAANGLSGTVTVYDVATREPVATVPVGPDPVGAWPGNDGRMYVDNERGQTVAVLDPGTAQVLARVELGFVPGMAAATRDGTLWVSDAQYGRVVVFEGDPRVRTAAIPTGRGAHGLAFSPDERTLYVTNQLEDTLTAIDVPSRTVRGSVRVGAKPNGLVFRPAP